MKEIREIKTIWNSIEHETTFDNEVNKALNEGYQLLDLKLSEPQIDTRKTLLFAFLIKNAKKTKK